MRCLADLLCEDLSEAAGTRNGDPHHGRLAGPLLHGVGGNNSMVI
jgi:hypothetical protein